MKYILFRDVALMGLPFYSYPCKSVELSPDDYGKGPPPKTWDDVIFYTTPNMGDLIFVEPEYYGGVPSLHNLLKLVFTRPECANCERTGTSSKPASWVDLK
jgi:hypothetical protein